MLTSNRWSLWIDVEGFSAIYLTDETRALLAIGSLMEAIFKVGSSMRGHSSRLFAHQFGDGFVIVSDFPEDSAERPLAIAISLMRHLLAQGIVCKAAVACGGFADVKGCYSEIVMTECKNSAVVSMGEGLMTIIPVMGTALITSHNLSRERRGSVLLIQEDCFQTLPDKTVIRTRSPTVVDWIHSDLDLSRRVSATANLMYLDTATAEVSLRNYIEAHGASVGSPWVSATLESNGMQARRS